MRLTALLRHPSLPAFLLALACASPAPEKRRSEQDATRLRALREAGTPRRVVLVTVAVFSCGKPAPGGT